MSKLSDEFNKIWGEREDRGKARGFRVYMEVRRILTGEQPRRLFKNRVEVLDKNIDFTLWELRLAEIIVNRIRKQRATIKAEEEG